MIHFYILNKLINRVYHIEGDELYYDVGDRLYRVFRYGNVYCIDGRTYQIVHASYMEGYEGDYEEWRY